MTLPSPTSSDEASRPDVDWQLALESMGGDAELLKSVVDVLVGEAPRQMATIEQSAASHDLKELRRAAHMLKGSLRYFGAERAASLAEQIELQGQTGKTDQTVEVIARLQVAIAQVLQELLDFRQRNSSSGKDSPTAP